MLAILSHYPQMFAAGVDLYGPTDLKSFLGRTAFYRRADRIAKYGDPVRDSTFMDAISPAKHASRIRSLLLVVQGENDPIVLPAESQDIVRLIRKNHHKVEYLLLRG